MRILLHGGLIFSRLEVREKPFYQNLTAYRNVLIIDGVIKKIGKRISPGDADLVIDCTGKYVAPGLVDMHVHLRTPGQEQKETFRTGSLAALAGGFTTVVAMANTSPAIDNPELLRQVLLQAEREAHVKLYQVAAVTMGRKGEQLIDMLELAMAGAVAFSDDGDGINDLAVLGPAVNILGALGKAILLHCQDKRFDPYDPQAEIEDVKRALYVAEIHDAPVHIQHVSLAPTVQLIREAKAKGVKVTCETAPHYLTLTDEDFKRLGPNAKMNPPLRTKEDVAAVIAGVVDGTIDAIATDHAPHTVEEKNSDKPPFGIIGLETAVPVILSALSDKMHIANIIPKLTFNPAKILGLRYQSYFNTGIPADLTIIDPQKRKVVEPEFFYSLARNCPWAGQELQGWPVMVIKKGRIVMEEGEVLV